MSDRIAKEIELHAPVARVWRALTDYREFGAWFGVAFDSGPFSLGEEMRGHPTHPGYEHVDWRATVRAMEPERLFAFTWHPYAVDESADYSSEPTTLIEFRLEPIATGTRLTIVESGFEKIPPHRRAEALRMNEQGWSQQILNIRDYVAQHP
ncbi:MAG TPA: SRPBCC family protein [Gemmatimonadaceae bacterium]|nr:SRPBCC family protein [Gemmatimonadaceae bacterium]